MCEEQTVRIEGEEFVRVSIPMPKRFVEFIKEFGEWIGIDKNELDEYLGEYIIESVKASIWGDLDNVKAVAPLKYEYFCQKFSFE
jgi:hypothetical protein